MGESIDTLESPHLVNRHNYGIDTAMGNTLIGLGTLAVVGGEFSFMFLNYSVDHNIAKVIAGGAGGIALGALMKLPRFLGELFH